MRSWGSSVVLVSAVVGVMAVAPSPAGAAVLTYNDGSCVDNPYVNVFSCARWEGSYGFTVMSEMTTWNPLGPHQIFDSTFEAIDSLLWRDAAPKPAGG